MYLTGDQTDARIELGGGVVVPINESDQGFRGTESLPEREREKGACILVAKLRVAGARVAHKGTVVGAEMCDLTVGLVAEIRGIVAGSAAGVERVGKNCR